MLEFLGHNSSCVCDVLSSQSTVEDQLQEMAAFQGIIFEVPISRLHFWQSFQIPISKQVYKWTEF